jgi:hypothetical protein
VTRSHGSPASGFWRWGCGSRINILLRGDQKSGPPAHSRECRTKPLTVRARARLCNYHHYSIHGIGFKGFLRYKCIPLCLCCCAYAQGICHGWRCFCDRKYLYQSGMSDTFSYPTCFSPAIARHVG